MSERDDPESPSSTDLTSPSPSTSSSSSSSLISTLRVLFQSTAVLLRHRLHFLSIYALTALPISLLLFSLAVSAHPIESRVLSLESLARLSPTRFESREVLKRSRSDAISAFRLRASYSLPLLVLSLTALVSSASSASAAASGRRPSLSSAAAVARDRWPRVLVTSICVYVSMWVFLSVTGTLRAVLADSPGLKFIVFVVGCALEVYVMAVMGMAMVVSVLENRIGLEAIRVGSALMEGRRWSGFALSGLLVFLSGLIWWVLEGSMDGQDWTSLTGMVKWLFGIGRRAWLVPLYALLILWSYVVLTVFYCDCRRRNGNAGWGREGENEMMNLGETL